MKKDNNLLLFLLGLAMTLAGVILFLTLVRVGSFSFSGLFRGNPAPVILIVWCLLFLLFTVTASSFSAVLLGIATLAFIIAVIANARIYIVTTSLFRFVSVLILIFGGAGLMVRYVVKK